MRGSSNSAYLMCMHILYHSNFKGLRIRSLVVFDLQRLDTVGPGLIDPGSNISARRNTISNAELSVTNTAFQVFRNHFCL